jgi:hypothetical protein
MIPENTYICTVPVRGRIVTSGLYFLVYTAWKKNKLSFEMTKLNKFSSLLFTVTSTTDFTPRLKLVCNGNIVYRNLKSESSQDYAQKRQQNCTLINSASYSRCYTVSSMHSSQRQEMLRERVRCRGGKKLGRQQKA